MFKKGDMVRHRELLNILGLVISQEEPDDAYWMPAGEEQHVVRVIWLDNPQAFDHFESPFYERPVDLEVINEKR